VKLARYEGQNYQDLERIAIHPVPKQSPFYIGDGA
jgi:hypothetical protein